MADVATPSWGQVPFRRSPVNHAPSPVGFGFGLSATPAWSSSSATHAPLSPWNINPISHPQPYHVRPIKRRREFEDEDARGKLSSDDAMDRSPTPERPKRTVPKRAKTTPSVPNSKTADNDKGGKSSCQDENDVDVGVLLASLPPETLLPLLRSLISSQPSLKSSVLALIPRPTLDTATQAVAKSAKKLFDAYPYSTGSPSHNLGDFNSARSPGFGSAGFVFGSSRPSYHAAHAPEGHHTTGMRTEYVISRLRPHIQDFVSACLSYLPYFSHVDTTSLDITGASQGHAHMRSHASALQSQHKDRSHPSETFLFLHALTTHVLNQPPLTQSLLIPQLMPRLAAEWNAWVDRVDQVVNRDGGMFGQEVVRSWERGLDEFTSAAEAEKESGLHNLQDVRDRWVAKVGWLVGRQPMEP